MTEFVLNQEMKRTDMPKGMVLLDFIRENAHLKGTKITCREGDCGACTVLIGTLKEGKLHYESIVSCLTPLGFVHGKHVVTIEGLNMNELNPVQQAFHQNHATQCGFCTPGFVVSLTGSLMTENKLSLRDQVAGNICRCTGYLSINAAIDELEYNLKKTDYIASPGQAVKAGFIPDYFSIIPGMLKKIEPREVDRTAKWVGGGTDLYVQKADKLYSKDLYFPLDDQSMRSITKKNNKIIIGAAATVTDLLQDPVMKAFFPSLKEDLLLVSSLQIRNTATIAGNFVNASPIGDLTIWFLALNAKIHLTDLDGGQTRLLNLDQFFIDYKKLNMNKGEILTAVEFELPGVDSFFSFEKVSKRKYLDIASVNTACLLRINDESIKEVYLAAGGVAPIPKRLKKTENYLINRKLNQETLFNAVKIMVLEVAPIDDIRGSSAYKKLLLRQLFLAHFEKALPGILSPEQLKNQIL